MSLPNQLKSSRMTDDTVGDRIDNEVGNLETAVADIVGIPIDTAIANQLFLVDAAGLKKLKTQDLGFDPNLPGDVARFGTMLRFHNGLTVGSVPLIIDKANAATTVANTTNQSSVYTGGLAANLLGTNGRLRLTAIGRFNIKANHTLTLTAAILGLVNLSSLLIGGGTTTDRSFIPIELVCEIMMNGATNSARVKLKGLIQQQSLTTDSPGFGAAGGSNSSISIVDSSAEMAVAQTIQLYAQWSNADLNNSITFYQFLLELLN